MNLKYYQILISLSIILAIASCQKEVDTFEFGITQTSFEQDSVYLADTDGILIVRLEVDGISWVNRAIIYSDDYVDPTTIVGEISPIGSISLPIQNENYWKVTTQGNIEKLHISWTPIE